MRGAIRFQRQALAGGAAVDGGFRHPVHDRRRFVLGHRMPPRLTQIQQSVRTVVAHARQQDADARVAETPGHRLEQHRGGRTLCRDRRNPD